MTMSWVEVFAGVLAVVGLFGLTVGYLLRKLDDKVSRDTFQEYCRRIDDHLISGNARFQTLETLMKENQAIMNDLCRQLQGVKTILGMLARKYGVEMRREEDPEI
jgi:hypothetical protein